MEIYHAPAVVSVLFSRTMHTYTKRKNVAGSAEQNSPTVAQLKHPALTLMQLVAWDAPSIRQPMAGLDTIWHRRS